MGEDNLLSPYPSWSWHQNPYNCSKERIVSVSKIRVNLLFFFNLLFLNSILLFVNFLLPNLIKSETLLYNFQVDECGRLWVLDNGKIESSRVCPPQILAFDIKTVSMYKLSFMIFVVSYKLWHQNRLICKLYKHLKKENTDTMGSKSKNL